MSQPVLPFEVFRERFAAEFDLPLDSVNADSRLIDDLGFDSFELFRTAIFLEMLTPIDLPDEFAVTALTLGDVYQFYAVEASRPEPPFGAE